MSELKSFGAYWAARLFGSGMESTFLEGNTDKTKGADDLTTLIEAVTPNDYEKVGFVNRVTSIVESTTENNITGREIAIELFRLGYANNTVQAPAFGVIEEIKKSAGGQLNTYTTELVRNMNAVFLVCNGTAKDFPEFSEYITKGGTEKVSKKFPHRHEQYCEQALGTAFLVKRYAGNPRKGLMVTAAHVLHAMGEQPENIRFYSGFFNKPEQNTLNVYRYVRTIFELGSGETTDSDWALVEVEGEDAALPEPIPFGGDVRDGDNTYCLGYPFGLPLKLSWDGMVFDTSFSKFKCKLLSYGGNSGSPVFNDKNEVVGILKGVDKLVDANRDPRVFMPKVYLFARYGALCHPINVVKEICSQPKFFNL